MHRLVYELDPVLAFVKQYQPSLPRSEGMQGIGLASGDEMIAGVLFEHFNGQTVWMHVAGKGGHWLTRKLRHAVAAYPFVQLKVKAVRALISASNTRSVRFARHLGFVPEATLYGAAADGGDAFVFVMRREWCRYV